MNKFYNSAITSLTIFSISKSILSSKPTPDTYYSFGHIAKGTFKSQLSARVAGKTSLIAIETAVSGTSASVSNAAEERPDEADEDLLVMPLSATRTGQHRMCRFSWVACKIQLGTLQNLRNATFKNAV